MPERHAEVKHLVTRIAMLPEEQRGPLIESLIAHIYAELRSTAARMGSRWRFLDRRADAGDIAQEAAMRLNARLATITPETQLYQDLLLSVRRTLRKCCRNVLSALCKIHVKTQKRSVRRESDRGHREGGFDIYDRGQKKEDLYKRDFKKLTRRRTGPVTNQNRIDYINQHCVPALPPVQREVFVRLWTVAPPSKKQVAKELNCSVDTVERRYNKARELIRRCMNRSP